MAVHDTRALDVKVRHLKPYCRAFAANITRKKSLKKSFFSSSSQLGTFPSLKSQIRIPYAESALTQDATKPPKNNRHA